jgi:hypothetical protein
MAITPATAYGVNMAKIVGAAAGQLPQLPEVTLVGGKLRCFNETVTYAAQAAPTVIGVARLPVPFALQFITLLASATSGTTTLALGNAANGNSAIYKAAAAFTAVDTLTFFALSATYQQIISVGVDSQGISLGPNSPGQGGGAYEDIILTLAAAGAPAAGTLKLGFYYTID